MEIFHGCVTNHQTDPEATFCGICIRGGELSAGEVRISNGCTAPQLTIQATILPTNPVHSPVLPPPGHDCTCSNALLNIQFQNTKPEFLKQMSDFATFPPHPPSQLSPLPWHRPCCWRTHHPSQPLVSAARWPTPATRSSPPRSATPRGARDDRAGHGRWRSTAISWPRGPRAGPERSRNC